MATRNRERVKSEAEIVKTLRRIKGKGHVERLFGRGKPRAALVRLTSFLREIEAARREYAAKGGVPLEEARRRIRRR